MSDIYDIASDIKTHESVLRLLSTNDDIVVVSRIAGNISTPIDVIKNIFKNKGYHYSIRCELAKNPNTPVWIQEELLTYSSSVVRKLLALNVNIAHNILDKLSEDDDVEVRIDVICNKKATFDTLKKLLKDPSMKILMLLSYDQRVPHDEREELIRYITIRQTHDS